MGLFNRMKEPVFLKESSNVQNQIDKLQELLPFLNEEGRNRVELDMKCLKTGIAGEENIGFELKNSHMPMFILHDIYLELGGLNAQIDYLVFTRKMCFVIECKNLFGNITITSEGDFIRETEFEGKPKKEGMFSPVTQNKHHIELIKLMNEGKQGTMARFVSKLKPESEFGSLIVLANAKTILRDYNAPLNIKKQVIRADRLVTYMKDVYNNSKLSEKTDEKLKEWAQYFLEQHKEIEKDYLKKYDKYKVEENQDTIIEDLSEAEQEISVTAEQTQQPETACVKIEEKMESEITPQVDASIQTITTEAESPAQVEETPLYKALKRYRWQKSKEEGNKPYFLFNNRQMEDLIAKMPSTDTELLKVSGFGEIKVKKYGSDILSILNHHRDHH